VTTHLILVPEVMHSNRHDKYASCVFRQHSVECKVATWRRTALKLSLDFVLMKITN
jgi:hypothetical protein